MKKDWKEYVEIFWISSMARCAIRDETGQDSILALVSLTGLKFLNQIAEFNIGNAVFRVTESW